MFLKGFYKEFTFIYISSKLIVEAKRRCDIQVSTFFLALVGINSVPYSLISLFSDNILSAKSLSVKFDQ